MIFSDRYLIYATLRQRHAERFVLDRDAGVFPGSLVKGKLSSLQVAKDNSTSQGDREAIGRDNVNATSLLDKLHSLWDHRSKIPKAEGFQRNDDTPQEIGNRKSPDIFFIDIDSAGDFFLDICVIQAKGEVIVDAVVNHETPLQRCYSP
ncbi:MAG: hypothetical protein Q9171_004235 [Xanthocarpia ochracea]